VTWTRTLGRDRERLDTFPDEPQRLGQRARERADDVGLETLRKAVGQIAGKVPNAEVQWSEAFRFRLEHHLGRLWFLLEPTVWLERLGDDDRVVDTARDFRRERLAGRYNKNWNALLDAWSQLFTRGAEVRAFGIEDGVDAVFKIGKVTAFSAR
jgi:hypothetical protein